MQDLLKDTPAFIDHVMRVFNDRSRGDRFLPQGIIDQRGTSAVLFLLGLPGRRQDFSSDIRLILNKRSLKVKQPGDLCCPGGSISARWDAILARLLHLPGSPLTRWPYWRAWRQHRTKEACTLALLFAAGLRESFEEMHLNPFKVRLLGTMPSQRLIMFRRTIHPLICGVYPEGPFRPNWEVEKVVYIPLRKLLHPGRYALYRLQINTSHASEDNQRLDDFPCFLHEHRGENEVLWGATFYITMVFLEMVFGFKPPDIESLPVIHGTLDKNYLTGNV